MKIPTGAVPIDKLLKGGLESDIITTFYGPAGSGKTNIALISTATNARSGKVIFIDTEGGFSFERLEQIAGPYFKDILKNIILFKPMTFQEQKKYVYRTFQLIKTDPEKYKLIIIDSLSMLYRLELGEEAREVNKELGRQMQILSEISRRYNIPVLVTNQVYSPFEEREKIEIVGGDIPKYWSKCLVELRIVGEGIREAILRKHRSLPEGKSIKFKIVNSGLIEVKEEGEN